jgi:hypothetical protein
MLPQFSFYNSGFDRQILGEPAQTLQINFGDGTGWHNMTGGGVSAFGITYPAAGTYMIEMRLLDDDNNVIRHAESPFRVLTNHHKKIANGSLDAVEGITTAVHLGCGHDHIVKPLVYLEGIDLPETRDVYEIYDEMISQTNLVMLKDYDYDIIVVNWAYSKADLRTNADHVIQLLETIQTQMGDTDNNQIVLMGESMGGLIGRYALTKMETSDYINGTGAYHTPHPKSHNTRLFISVDGAQQGGYVPLSAQFASEILYKIPAALRKDIWRIKFLTEFAFLQDNMLRTRAVQQMLIEHALTYDPVSKWVGATDAKDSFFQELRDMNPASGGYPVHCKKMALTNALIDSGRQVGIANRILQPLDTHLDMDLKLGIRILRLFYRPSYELSIQFKANPDGSGNIMQNGIGKFTYFNFWCGFKKLIFKEHSCNLFAHSDSFNATVNFVKPYDVMPGGTQPSVGGTFTSLKEKHKHLNLFIFAYDFHTDPFHGNVLVSFNYGTFNPKVFSFTASSQIVNFDFMPMYSALDYHVPNSSFPLDHDILHDDINVTLSRTPFDVIVGEYQSGSYPQLGTDYAQNFEHLNMRSDVIPTTSLTYLTREIGDEVLYLDNLNINRKGMFEAKNNILAGNNENPFYDYPVNKPGNTPSTGMFSKQGGFINDSAGDIELKAGSEIRLQAGFESKSGSKLWVHIAPEHTCDLSLDQLKKKSPSAIEKDEQSEDSKGDILIYPNPSSSLFIIKLALPEQTEGKATLLNELGQVMSTQVIPAGSDQLSIDAGRQAFSNGVYILIVQYKDKILKEKLILNKN